MKPSVFLAFAALAAVAGPNAEKAAAAPAKAAHSAASRAQDWTLTVNKAPSGGFVMGNPDAKVKLIEYGSMTCPHCARFDESAVPKLVAGYVKTGKVSWEFRNYVRDATDVTASLVARCGGTKAFFPATRALYKEQASWEKKIGDAPQDALEKINDLPLNQKFLAVAKLVGFQQWAAARGVPVKKSTQCLTSEDSVNQLVQMTSDASTQFPDFPGTPTFVINGTMVEFGKVTEDEVWPTLEAQIKSALGQG
ncbi:MAG TPA: thioredoxin domain-containing protein [Sphingomicrobium sp.]|jgi:protein-disulfide isomerase